MSNNDKHIPKWIVIVSALLFIAGVVMFILMDKATSDFEKQYAVNSAKIGDLLMRVDELKIDADKVETEEVVSNKLTSCAALGSHVAELQTKYQTMSASENYDDWMENVYALDACFSETSKDSRVPWFVPVRSHDVEWEWEFQSTYSFTNKQVDVIWLCKDVANGDILAYSTGVYDTESGLFDSVKCILTSIGFKYQQDDMDESGGNDVPVADDSDKDESVDDDKPSDNWVDPSITPPGIGSGGVGPNGPDDDADDSNNSDDDFDINDFEDYDTHVDE